MSTSPERLEFITHLPGWVGPVAAMLVMVAVPAALVWSLMPESRR